MEDVKRVLVVSRMTKYCRKAVRYGAALSKECNAELYVIHVIHNPFGYEGWNLPIASLEKDYSNIQEKAKAELHEIIEKERADGLPVKELLKTGEPTKEILKVVQDENIDLMIMLAHEEGRLEHFLFGRSNEELIRKIPCSILLVKKEPRRARDLES